jgi:hypothetical protein
MVFFCFFVSFAGNDGTSRIPQGHFLRARLRQGIFAHCGERPKGVALWTPTTFEKVDKTFKFENYFSKDFFDKLIAVPIGTAI